MRLKTKCGSFRVGAVAVVAVACIGGLWHMAVRSEEKPGCGVLLFEGSHGGNTDARLLFSEVDIALRAEVIAVGACKGSGFASHHNIRYSVTEVLGARPTLHHAVPEAGTELVIDGGAPLPQLHEGEEVILALSSVAKSKSLTGAYFKIDSTSQRVERFYGLGETIAAARAIDGVPREVRKVVGITDSSGATIGTVIIK